MTFQVLFAGFELLTLVLKGVANGTGRVHNRSRFKPGKGWFLNRFGDRPRQKCVASDIPPSRRSTTKPPAHPSEGQAC